MFLTQTAEYGLRAMSVVAEQRGEPISGHEIAAQSDVPAPYLAKILRRLVVAELLVSKRGKGGGFRLSRPAEAITFAQILDAVEAMPGTSHCAFGWERCDEKRPCPLHDAYVVARGDFVTWAHRTRLARG